MSVVETLKPKWTNFLKENGVCPDCQTDKYAFPKNGELVCLKCGYVLKKIYAPLIRCSGVGNQNRKDAPVNKLCFGSSLGNPAISECYSLGGLCRVIASNGEEDLGIRAIQLRKECMKSQESDIRKRLKNYLSNWSKHYGWQENHILANSLGYNAEWVGTIMTMMNNGKNTKDLARAIFYINVHKFFGKQKADQIATELKIQQKYITKTITLLRLDNLIY